MEGGDSNHQTEANSSEVVVLQDDDDVKVYQVSRPGFKKLNTS